MSHTSRKHFVSSVCRFHAARSPIQYWSNKFSSKRTRLTLTCTLQTHRVYKCKTLLTTAKRAFSGSSARATPTCFDFLATRLLTLYTILNFYLRSMPYGHLVYPNMSVCVRANASVFDVFYLVTPKKLNVNSLFVRGRLHRNVCAPVIVHMRNIIVHTANDDCFCLFYQFQKYNVQCIQRA